MSKVQALTASWSTAWSTWWLTSWLATSRMRENWVRMSWTCLSKLFGLLPILCQTQLIVGRFASKPTSQWSISLQFITMASSLTFRCGKSLLGVSTVSVRVSLNRRSQMNNSPKRTMSPSTFSSINTWRSSFLLLLRLTKINSYLNKIKRCTSNSLKTWSA